MMKWWGWGDINKEFSIENRPNYLAFLRKYLKNLPTTLRKKPDIKNIHLPVARSNLPALQALQSILSSDQVKIDDVSRLGHIFGRSSRDILRLWKNDIHTAPDVVLFPRSHADVVNIMKVVNQYKLILIPFGGGTNVIGAVEVLPNMTQLVISLNMQQMKKVISIDSDSMTAVIEAGILGKELEEVLNAKGYTLGHFPDSFEYASLGGWIATRSAGMQSDGNGNIEDMLVAVNLISPTGEINTPISPRFSSGPDIKEIILGSEGILGVITQATMRISKFEPVFTHGILFPSFEIGAKAIQQCIQSQDPPLMMRLSDSEETKFSSSLQERTSFIQNLIKKLFFKYLKDFKKMDLEKTCIGFLSFKASDNAKKKVWLKKVKAIGAVDLGTKVGAQFIKNKYAPPYIRDYLMQYEVFGDTIETSALWKDILVLHDTVLAKTQAYFAEKFDGSGFVGCHISHSYRTGACLYFTYGMPCKDETMLTDYIETKKFILNIIMDHGGSISHHHSVGYEHMPWMKRHFDEKSITLITDIKQHLDPENLCNPGKLIPNKATMQHYWPNFGDQE